MQTDIIEAILSILSILEETNNRLAEKALSEWSKALDKGDRETMDSADRDHIASIHRAGVLSYAIEDIHRMLARKGIKLETTKTDKE